MTTSRFLLAFSILLALLCLPGCSTGDGSDIGPNLDAPAQSFLAGSVVDPSGLPIVGALVTIEGAAGTALTRRNGRFVFANPPTGTRWIQVDGRNGTADAEDSFPLLRFVHDIAGGKADLGRLIVLPDLQAGVRQSVNLGVLTADFTLDAGDEFDALLELSAGSAVSRGSANGSLDLSLSIVARNEFPRAVPASVTGVRISTRGVWLHPMDVEFSGASRHFTLPNDLGLTVAAKAELYRLDFQTGTWNLVGPGTVLAGGARIKTDQGIVVGGGLYAFLSSVSTSTMLSGRLLDAAGDPIRNASVLVAEAMAVTTDSAGLFTVGPVAAVDGVGAALNLPIRIVPSFGYSPRVLRSTVLAQPDQTALGDVTLDSFRSADVRTQALIRGRVLAGRRTSVGAAFQGFSGQGTTGDRGIFILPDAPLAWHSARISWVDGEQYFRGEALNELREGNDTLDLRVLSGEQAARPAEFNGTTSAVVLDRFTGAIVTGAVVQGSAASTTTSVSDTKELGIAFVTGNRFDTFTASYQAKVGGRLVTAAFSINGYDTIRGEFPIETARGAKLGRFDPHALFVGTLTQTQSGTKQRRLLVRPLFSKEDWFHRAMTGRTFAGDLPRSIDPELSGTAYLVGLPLNYAFLTGVEGTMTGGVFIPERLGVVADLRPLAGTRIQQDLALSLSMSEQASIKAVGGLDGNFTGADLRYQLGALRSDKTALDLLPSSGGITVTQVAGKLDLALPFPPEQVLLADVGFLVALTAEGTASSVFRSQALYFDVEDAATSVSPGSFLKVPLFTSPLPSATLSKDGFTASWQADPEADYYVLSLAAVNGTDDRYWTAVVPGNISSFEFGALVPAAKPILAASRTWTLSISAHRLTHGIGFGEPDGFNRIATNFFSVREGSRGVGALSMSRITISTGP